MSCPKCAVGPEDQIQLVALALDKVAMIFSLTNDEKEYKLDRELKRTIFQCNTATQQLIKELTGVETPDVE